MQTSGFRPRAGTRAGGRASGFLAWLKAKLWSEHWQVGVIHAPLERVLGGQAYPPVQWLNVERRDGFWADPFPYHDAQNGLLIFVEDYNYRRAKGSIAVLRYDPDPRREGSPNSVQVLWDFPWHTSYPYLFEADGQIYCVPETYQARQVLLYRAVRFPQEWHLAAVLLPDFAAVDSTLFFYGEYWWLFCTNADTGSDSHLHVWYAHDVHGPWHPHAGNPVKSDVQSSRSAGRPFWRNGHLYRPAQDCSQTYGGRVVINHIECLTPTEFREHTVSVVEPLANTPYAFGLHTLNSAGNFTIIDGKSYRFIPAYVWGEIKRKLKFRRRKAKFTRVQERRPVRRSPGGDRRASDTEIGD